MRASLVLLALLTAGAALAYGLLARRAHDCRALEREANAASAALMVCSKSFSCRFTYHDLVGVARQRVAADRCKDEP